MGVVTAMAAIEEPAVQPVAVTLPDLAQDGSDVPEKRGLVRQRGAGRGHPFRILRVMAVISVVIVENEPDAP